MFGSSGPDWFLIFLVAVAVVVPILNAIFSRDEDETQEEEAAHPPQDAADIAREFFRDRIEQ
jgi:hypothetical protein